MPTPMPEGHPPADSRRSFLKKSSAAAVGAAVVGNLAVTPRVHAGVDDTIKIGLIGCGGRGTGAAVNAMKADANCKLVAMADAFADRLEQSRRNLSKQGDKYAVTDGQCFVGFDAFKKLLETDVDVVLMATPPHFRPEHYRAAITAGKHCFVEKPVAVDAPGVRHVMETNKMAEAAGLSVVSGLCWRYDFGVRETMRRIREEQAIGDIVAIQSDYNTGTLWHRGDNPDWSRMEYQLRNWLYYAWLSGDHNVEQHIHSLDKTAWLLGDAHPIRVTGLGGRQQRTDPKWGHIFDHHAVVYEYEGGVRVFSYCRQQDGCSRHVDEYVMGTKGTAEVLRNTISGDEKWRYRGEKPNMYDQEHRELFASIRSGKPIHNGHYMANSTMIAIMGRMATYTGQTLTWDQCLASEEKLGPDKYEWVDIPEPPVAIPGKTKFS